MLVTEPYGSEDQGKKSSVPREQNLKNNKIETNENSETHSLYRAWYYPC